MQIPHGKPGPRQVLVVNGPSEVEEHSAAGPVLKIRVFLAIENRLLKDTLAHMLRRLGDVEVSGKSGGGETNPEEVAKSSSDVALLDFLDPGMSVVRKQTQEKGKAIKTIVIGMDAESAPFLEAVRCGVTGYADVTAAVRAVARGEASCPSEMCTLLFQTVAQMGSCGEAKKTGNKVVLTVRQQKLMRLVTKGLTNKDIAGELHLSEFTVRNHMSRILKQLGEA